MVEFEDLGVHPVAFAGTRSGVWRTTFVQDNTLDWIEREPAPGILRYAIPVPPGTTVEAIGSAVAQLLTRHESLRTVYPPMSGEVRLQQVLADGVIRIRVVGVSRRHDLGDTPLPEPFDHTKDLPIRVTVVTEGGEPFLAYFEVSHVAADMAAFALVASDFRYLVASTDQPAPPPLPPPGRQPADQAATEISPREQRRMANTLAYWNRQMHDAPLCAVGMPAPPGAAPEGYVTASLMSERAGLAIAAAAARVGTSTSAVVVAAYATLLTWWTGYRSVTAYSVSSNRFLPGMADYVGALAQEALITLPMSSTSFDDVLRDVGTKVLQAYRYAFYDARELVRLTDMMTYRRGIRRHRDVVINDVTGIVDEPAAATDTGGASVRFVREPLGREPLHLDIGRFSTGLRLAAGHYPHLIASTTVADYLYGVEALLVAAGTGDVHLRHLPELTRLQPIARDGNWAFIDSCWIDLRSVNRLVATALPDRVARVFAEPTADGGRRLVAYIGSPDVDLGMVHTACVAALGDGHGVMAPQWYVLVSAVPDDPDDQRCWRAARFRYEGSGRPEFPRFRGAF